MADTFHQKVGRARTLYSRFLESTYAGDGCYRLTTQSDISPFARCFAIFGCHLISDMSLIRENEVLLMDSMFSELEQVRRQRVEAGAALWQDKFYLQLLTFTLSAFAIIDVSQMDRLASFVSPLVERNVDDVIGTSGALNGRPQSGNQAMFFAILMVHATRYLDCDKMPELNRWVDLHLSAMNSFGFWGDVRSMTHLQFQNGYHQYEILDYLSIENPLAERAADNVAMLADKDGHFAPYPGGGGCYDYDAVFVLTCGGEAVVKKHRGLLQLTAQTLLGEQNQDGGFCESLYVRPRSIENVGRLLRHIASARGNAMSERTRYCLTLQRPVHDRIHTHWSQYSRRWNESDLWDSWFRMLAIARIDVALHGADACRWGFIDYPGIGFHHSLSAD